MHTIFEDMENQNNVTIRFNTKHKYTSNKTKFAYLEDFIKLYW